MSNSTGLGIASQRIISSQLQTLIGGVCGSLREALIALDNDRAFLTKGDVFSDDQIEAYMELKWEEVMRWETTPSPVEFDMYYSS